MMKFLLLLILSVNSLLAYSQSTTGSKEIFYLFDKADKPLTSLGEAATFEVVSKENDTCFIVRYYKNYGPMMWQQTFKDSALTIKNGRFIWYNESGDIDSTGILLDGKRNGEWNFFDSIAQNTITAVDKEKKKAKKNHVFGVSGFQVNNKYFDKDVEINNKISRIDPSTNDRIFLSEKI